MHRKLGSRIGRSTCRRSLDQRRCLSFLARMPVSEHVFHFDICAIAGQLVLLFFFRSNGVGVGMVQIVLGLRQHRQLRFICLLTVSVFLGVDNLWLLLLLLLRHLLKPSSVICVSIACFLCRLECPELGVLFLVDNPIGAGWLHLFL